MDGSRTWHPLNFFMEVKHVAFGARYRMSECFVFKSRHVLSRALKSPMISQSGKLIIAILFITLPPMSLTNPNPYKYTEKIVLRFSIYPSTSGFVIYSSLNRY